MASRRGDGGWEALQPAEWRVEGREGTASFHRSEGAGHPSAGRGAADGRGHTGEVCAFCLGVCVGGLIPSPLWYFAIGLNSVITSSIYYLRLLSLLSGFNYPWRLARPVEMCWGDRFPLCDR